MVSSVEGFGGVGTVAVLCFGAAVAFGGGLGGEGVSGRMVPGANGATGALRAGSADADAGSPSESEAKAFSRSLECAVQNCM